MIEITINGNACEVEAGATIIAAAAANGVYIPAVCNHPDLSPFKDVSFAERIYRGDTAFEHQSVAQEELRGLEGCGVCVVEVEGEDEPVRACHTAVAAGMSIRTDGAALKVARRTALMKIMSRHPHACITCAQREGCSLEDCSSNVPKEERCCRKFHNCELRKVAEYVGVKEETPRYRSAGMPVLDGELLIARDFNLCIDCARCVRVCNQVRGVEALGVVYHEGRLVVGSIAPTLIDSACKFCGACVEVCPTGCLMDKAAPAGEREQWLLPCVHTCPAGVDVPGYIRRIAAGDFKGAAAIVWERLPLANVLGHICFHLCEYECRREAVDEPIAICALKRFALEAGDGELLSEIAELPSSGKRVAIVGAGPAGLAAAFFLRFKGHGVTVFEAGDAPGGMAAQSIPDYRLPLNVLDRDLAAIRKLGVDIKTGQRLDKAAMTTLLEDGYDAVLIAVGLPHSKKIELEGSALSGVHWGLEFLNDVKAGNPPNLGQRVIVVGGGNVAVDVAMTALRLAGGPRKDSRPSVRLFCLESRDEMPAHAHELAKAEAEGVEIHPGWGPAAIVGDGDRVSGVEFRRCVAVFDERHNFAPRFDEEQRTTVEADAVILAIGQAPPEGIPAERGGVFLAGDIVGGTAAGSIVHAVASARTAAERIDRHIGGDGQIIVQIGERTPPRPWIGREEGFVPRPRVPIPCADPQQRCADFRPVESTYSREAAIAEAERCLQCDLRLMVTPPPLPPEKWLEFNRANVEQVPAVDGVFVLADASKKVTVIKGTESVQAGLLEKLDAGAEAHFFRWEEDRMFTKRESELIQQHMEQYGELPGGGDELDDLF